MQFPAFFSFLQFKMVVYFRLLLTLKLYFSRLTERLAEMWAAGTLDHFTVEHRFNEGLRDCKICSLYSNEVSLYGGFFSMYFVITGAENVVRYAQDFV